MAPATGLFGAPGESMASLIAACASFQTFCGAANSAAARESVYTELVSRSSSTPQSRAVVSWIDGGMNGSRDASSAGLASFSKDITMSVIFEREFASVSAAYAGIAAFRDAVSAIIKDMLAASGSESTLYIRAFSFKGFFLDDKSQPPALSAVFTFSWGY